jgi:SAM-dependent methyltransferase
MILFPYREFRYYSFGLKAGLSNLLHNGLRLGAKTTLGKIAQPVNWYTRFPEYYFFDSAISRHLAGLGTLPQPRILDLGSPKLLGLYLARTTGADLTLTDITPLNIDEYRVMWDSLSPKAKGRAQFQLQDARALDIPNEAFDVVYSMSVIEHIEGDSGDSEAVREMIRVLKPGGLFIISVPCGSRYLEQDIIGVSGSALETHDRKPYFFQRIYDEAAFKTRILGPASGLHSVALHTIWRRHIWMHRTFARFGENLRGVFGFINPFLSAVANQSCDGINSAFTINYERVHSLTDIYGDIVMTGVKAR